MLLIDYPLFVIADYYVVVFDYYYLLLYYFGKILYYIILESFGPALVFSETDQGALEVATGRVLGLRIEGLCTKGYCQKRIQN